MSKSEITRWCSVLPYACITIPSRLLAPTDTVLAVMAFTRTSSIYRQFPNSSPRLIYSVGRRLDSWMPFPSYPAHEIKRLGWAVWHSMQQQITSPDNFRWLSSSISIEYQSLWLLQSQSLRLLQSRSRISEVWQWIKRDYYFKYSNQNV